MKTPSLLPLLLFAALPAAAEPKPGARCDVEWLEKTQALMSQSGRTVSDERVEVVGDYLKLKFGHLKTCDAATWRHLATLEPIASEPAMDTRTRQPVGGAGLRWRNAAAADFWKDTAVAQHIGLVLVVNDFYAAIDAKAAAVVAAGDAVIDAAKALGFADYKVSEKSLAELAIGTTGGPIGALKPRLVTVLEEGKQAPATVAPEQLGPTMRKLVNDGPTLGDSVVAFRLAVLEVEAAIGSLGKSEEILKKRIAGATPGLSDLTSGLPKDFVLIEAKKANAMADEKYGTALAALVGPGTAPEFKDQGLRGSALLDPIDQGVRNLIAIRSAEVDKIVAAAKKRLNGKTIAQYETGARTAAVTADKKASPLAAAVLDRLSQTPEYARLDVLYENNLRDKGPEWAKLPEAQKILAARESLKEAALSATIEPVNGRDAVVFTQNGSKRVLTSLVPSSVANDDAARSSAASAISRLIVTGALDDAKYQSAVAAIGGQGQPGQSLETGLKPGEREVAKDIPVPPAMKKIKDGAAGCTNPKDLIRNDYETYAARQRAAAADMASANVRSRGDVEKKRLEQLAAADLACKQKKDEAAAIQQDYFDDPAIAKAAREKAAAEAEAGCVAAKKAIEESAQAKIKELAAGEAGARDPAKLRARADSDLAAGFAVAISASIETLRKEYTTPGSKRLTCSPTPDWPCTESQKKLAEITRGSARLPAFTALWFDKEYPQEPSKKTELEAALAACAKDLGLGGGSGGPSYRNPENPNNVDRYCKVNERLTKYIIDSKGSVRPAK